MLINLFSISVRFLCFCRNFVEASGVIFQVVEFPHSMSLKIRPPLDVANAV